jgi:hypothetical protein
MKTWIIYSTSSTSSDESHNPLVAELLDKMAREVLLPFQPIFKRTKRQLFFQHQHADAKATLKDDVACIKRAQDVLAYLPSHSTSVLYEASRELRDHPIIVMGINGDKETIRSSTNAFNIGVHDDDLRWQAIKLVAERESGELEKFLITDDKKLPDWDGAENFTISHIDTSYSDVQIQEEIIDTFKNSNSRVIVLNSSVAIGSRILKLVGKSWSNKAIIRRGGSYVRHIEGARTIDAVGFHSLDGIVRLLERVHPKPLKYEIQVAVLDASWRIDATYLLATAFRNAIVNYERNGKDVCEIDHVDLVREMSALNGDECILETPGRWIAFDADRMNRSRSVTLLERSNSGREPSLYPIQITANGDWQQVVQMQFQPLWFGEVEEAKGTFECDFILSLWAPETNINFEELVFPTSVGKPELSKLAVAKRALKQPSESAHGPNPSNFSSAIRIRGKFRFDPDVANYPFDRQEFCIAIELSGSSASYALQPAFVGSIRPDIADGWSVIDSKTGRRSWTTPIQSGAQKRTWEVREGVTFRLILKRMRPDVIPRSVLPAAFLIVVTWLTSFWTDPVQVAGILVNALLACIGLYFSESKPIPGRTTLVDRLFMVCYGLIGFRLGAVIATFGSSSSEEMYRDVNIASRWIIPLAIFLMLWWTWKRIRL